MNIIAHHTLTFELLSFLGARGKLEKLMQWGGEFSNWNCDVTVCYKNRSHTKHHNRYFSVLLKNYFPAKPLCSYQNSVGSGRRCCNTIKIRIVFLNLKLYHLTNKQLQLKIKIIAQCCCCCLESEESVKFRSRQISRQLQNDHVSAQSYHTFNTWLCFQVLIIISDSFLFQTWTEQVVITTAHTEKVSNCCDKCL